jgi:hypothetical protein
VEGLRTGDDFPIFAELRPDQRFPRGMAIDERGTLRVTGTYGSVDEPGWISSFDSHCTHVMELCGRVSETARHPPEPRVY